MKTNAKDADPLALEVTVRWGDDVIATRRLTGEAEAVLGAAPGAVAAVPCAALGQEAFLLARLVRGRAIVCVPEGCVASWRGAEAEAEAEAGAAGAAAVVASSRLVAGPKEIPIGAGESVTLYVAGFHVLVVAAAGEERPPWAMTGPWRGRSAGVLPHVAVAALLHALVAGLAAQAAIAGELAPEPDTGTAEALRGYLAAAERRAEARDPTLNTESSGGDGKPQNERTGNGKQGGGARAQGEEGAMGAQLSRAASPRRFALPRRSKSEESALAEARGIEGAHDFGMIGLLAAGREHAPAASFGEAAARGLDAIAADGSMWARALGEHAGVEALGLTGIGEGGGGSGLGVGLDRVGTVGHTNGPPGAGTGGQGGPPRLGFGISGGWGRWSSHIRGSHRTRGPIVRWGEGVSVSGRLPPEAIQRIIRQNFGRFRGCYEQGLFKNPTLAGRVTVRFVIGRDGAVSSVADGGSDVPDRAMVGCVVRAFYGLSFPQPEGGVVNVAYPIVFSPE